jgi:uncharacterized protein
MEKATPVLQPARRRRAVLRVGLLVLGLAFFAWFGGSAFVAYQFTRRPHAPFPEPTPELDWGTVESHRLTTSDGEQIGTWYVPGSENGPSVVLLHGNGGQRQDCLSRGKLLSRRGCSVLMLTARAHGDSSGEYNDFGYGARHDVIAAVEFLERRRPGRPVLLLGISLGAAASTFAARDLGDRVHGCFLELPYRDLRTATWNRMRAWLPPVLDSVGHVGLTTAGQLFVPHLDRISPLEAVGDIPATVPVWILAGGRDAMARPAEAEALLERVKDHARLTVFPEARHESLLRNDPERYTAALDDWLGQVRTLP